MQEISKERVCEVRLQKIKRQLKKLVKLIETMREMDREQGREQGEERLGKGSKIKRRKDDEMEEANGRGIHKGEGNYQPHFNLRSFNYINLMGKTREE